MAEFRLYFHDGDDAHAAEKRVVTYGNEIRTLDDVRTDLRDFCQDSGTDPIGVAREYQKRLRSLHGVVVTWPASHDGDGASWELILKADSIEDVQAFVGVDLDYMWETG